MTDPDFRVCAAAGVGVLQRWYDQSTGQWTSTGWWNAANALTAVIRYTKLTGDTSHEGCIATTFAAAQRQHADSGRRAGAEIGIGHGLFPPWPEPYLRVRHTWAVRLVIQIGRTHHLRGRPSWLCT